MSIADFAEILGQVLFNVLWMNFALYLFLVGFRGLRERGSVLYPWLLTRFHPRLFSLFVLAPCLLPIGILYVGSRFSPFEGWIVIVIAVAILSMLFPLRQCRILFGRMPVWLVAIASVESLLSELEGAAKAKGYNPEAPSSSDFPVGEVFLYKPIPGGIELSVSSGMGGVLVLPVGNNYEGASDIEELLREAAVAIDESGSYDTHPGGVLQLIIGTIMLFIFILACTY